MYPSEEYIEGARRIVRICRWGAATNFPVGLINLALGVALLRRGWGLINLAVGVFMISVAVRLVTARAYRYWRRVARGENVPLSEHYDRGIREITARLGGVATQLVRQHEQAPWQ